EAMDLADGRVSRDHFDCLLFSTGAAPVTIPAAGMSGCFTVRTIEDALAIDRWISDRDVRSAAIVGGGLVGLEMAEALRRRALNTTVIEQAGQLLPQVDADVASTIETELRANQVTVLTGTSVEDVVGDSEVQAVVVDGI